MITIDIELETDVNRVEVVGHSSAGPVGLRRFDLGVHDAVVLTLSDAEAAALVERLAQRLRANLQREERAR